jgi:hypothetical protein
MRLSEIYKLQFVFVFQNLTRLIIVVALREMGHFRILAWFGTAIEKGVA